VVIKLFLADGIAAIFAELPATQQAVAADRLNCADIAVFIIEDCNLNCGAASLTTFRPKFLADSQAHYLRPEVCMIDLLVLVTTAGFFLASIAYVAGCERL
jgi:hypothetical protein